jgi:hypothetical protein
MYATLPPWEARCPIRTVAKSKRRNLTTVAPATLSPERQANRGDFDRTGPEAMNMARKRPAQVTANRDSARVMATPDGAEYHGGTDPDFMRSLASGFSVIRAFE